MKRGRWRTVRNAEWTAAFLAVYSSQDGLLTRDSHLFCSASSSSEPNALGRTGPVQFNAVQPDWSLSPEGCRLKTRSAPSGAAPTTRSRMTTRRRPRAFPTSRFSWCRNVRSCWHRAPWAPIWWVYTEQSGSAPALGLKERHISVYLR